MLRASLSERILFYGLIVSFVSANSYPDDARQSPSINHADTMARVSARRVHDAAACVCSQFFYQAESILENLI